VSTPAEQAAPSPGTSLRRNAGWLAALGLGLLAKGKTLLGLLKVLPAGKFLLTGFSMLAMVWFEALRSGIWFGVGFVLLILIHELGHGYAIKRAGLTAGWPVFIPFFGAMISMKGMPRDRSQEAAIAYGGPLAGTAAALGVAVLGMLTDSRLLFALAYTGFFLNLFNLTPISPLDGGRVAQAFSRRAWIFGAIVLGVMFLATRAPQLLLIGLLALPQLLNRAVPDDRDALPAAEQRAWAFRYFGLASFLGAAMYVMGSFLGRN
jgi:Zn-dependent protease